MPDDVEATYIRIPVPIKDALREAADQEERPLSSQIVVVLKEWYQQRVAEKVPA